MNKHPINGYSKPITINGIPLQIHWTFPAGGLFLAFFLNDWSLLSVGSLVIAYSALILIHELGHAIAAKLYSLKVHVILITAVGGWCYTDMPTSFRSKLMLYSGGLIAQIVLLTLTVSILLIFGSPSSTVPNCFVFVFTIVNIIVLVINFYPTGITDGKRLWSLFYMSKFKKPNQSLNSDAQKTRAS